MPASSYYYKMRNVKWKYNEDNKLLHSENFYNILYNHTEKNATADADFICNSEGNITHIGVWIDKAIAPLNNIHCNLKFENYDTEIKDFLRTLLLVGNEPLNKVTETNQKICALTLFQLDCIIKDGQSSYPTQNAKSIEKLSQHFQYNEPPHAPRNTASPQPSGGPSSQSKPVNPAVLAASVVFWAMVVNQYYTRKKRNAQEGLSKPSIRLSQRAGARRHRRTRRRFGHKKTTKL